MIFVDAFCSSNCYFPIPRANTLSLLPTPRSFDPTGSLALQLAPSTSSAIAIESEQFQGHIVTVPPFLPESDHDPYPSLLHQIHIVPLLTDDETSELLRLARRHAAETQSWDQQDSSRHVSYPTVDFAIEESIEISQYLGQSGIQFEERIFDALSKAYDVDVEDFSFLDLFCASYEAQAEGDTVKPNEGRNTMDRLAFHRDGSLLSFTVLLSPPVEFQGGGTVFDALRDVDTVDNDNPVLQSSGVIQPPQAGYATLHSGKLLHGGNVVTKGQRIVLVGFVDVSERNVKSGALGNATKDWGRNDVRTFWNLRRMSLLKQQHRSKKEGNIKEEKQPLWKLKSWRYLPNDTTKRRLKSNEGRSYFGKDSTMPTSSMNNIQRRSRLENIRRRQLITECRLLREMLLPREERGVKINGEEGEWLEVEQDSMDGLLLGWDEGVDGGS